MASRSFSRWPRQPHRSRPPKRRPQLQLLEPRLPLDSDSNPTLLQVSVGEVPTTSFELKFSESMQIATLIEDGTITSAISLIRLRSGAVPLKTRQLAYSDATHTLTWSSTMPLAPGYYELALDGAKLLDQQGQALLGGSAGLSFHLPELAADSPLPSQGAPLTVPGYSVPALADWNADGLLDLLVGEQDSPSLGKLRVYLNSGSLEAPVYDAYHYVQYADDDLSEPCSGCLGVFPRVADWNQDGRQDLLLGLADGRIKVFLNTSADQQAGAEPVLGEPIVLESGAAGTKTTIDVGDRATLEAVDWNNDGRIDLVAGGLDGKVRVYLNSSATGSPDLDSPILVQAGSGDLSVPSGRASVSVHDLNGDGRKDLLVGNTEGRLLFYPNVGTDAAPAFAAWQALQAAGAEIDLAGIPRSRPLVSDFDADGLPDLLVGAGDGQVHWYRATSWDTPRTGPGQVGNAAESYRYVFQVAAAAWQNAIEPLDVTGDQLIVPLDALTIINELNTPQHTDAVGQLQDPPAGPLPAYLDVNGDGYCTSIDALLVINQLNQPAATSSPALPLAAVPAVPAGQISAQPSPSDIAAAIDFLFAQEATARSEGRE